MARFKIGGNHNEVFIVTDNSLHSSGVLAPRSHLIADLVMGRLTPAPIWRQKNYRFKFLLRTALFYNATRAMLEVLGMILISCWPRRLRCRAKYTVNI